MKRFTSALISIALAAGTFLAGIYVGGQKEHLLDPLCRSNASLAITTQDLVSKNISIGKGTLVSLQKCEYADRFSIKFYTGTEKTSSLFKAFVPMTEAEKSDYKKMGVDMAQYSVGPDSERGSISE